MNPTCGFTQFTKVIPCFYLPTRPVCEYNVTLFITSFNESHTRVLFPVPHGLLEHGSLAAWKNSETLPKQRLPQRQVLDAGSPPSRVWLGDSDATTVIYQTLA